MTKAEKGEMTMADLIAIIPNKGDRVVLDGWECTNEGTYPMDPSPAPDQTEDGIIWPQPHADRDVQ